MAEQQHWATLQGDELVEAIVKKFTGWEDDLEQCGDVERMKLSTLAYFGEDEKGRTTIRPTPAGDDGEARVLKVNEYRSVLTNKVTIATADPPGFMPVPTNTDAKSFSAQQLSTGLEDYYFNELRAEDEITQAVETGEALAWSWVDVQWDPTAGAEAEPDNPAELIVTGPDGAPAVGQDGAQLTRAKPHEGDVRVRMMMPSDVAFDIRRRDTERPWLILRRWRNKWDLAAELEASHMGDQAAAEAVEEIRGMGPPASDSRFPFLYGWSGSVGVDSDDVEVLELRHLPTPAVRGGKLTRVVGRKVLIEDGGLPYEDLSCYRYEAGRRFGTARSYTSMHDSLGLQVAVDAMGSLIYTALRVGGVPPLYAEEGTGVTREQLGPLVIFYGRKPQAPQPIDLPQPSDGTYKFWEATGQKMATLQGLDDLSMGRDDRQLSGAAMALLDTRTQRSVSRTAKGAQVLRLQVGNAILRVLRRFAKTSRKVTLLVGKSKAPMLKEFTGADLEPIARVTLETVSSISKSPAGRLEMAKDLLMAKAEGGQPLINAQQYMAVATTGRLDPMTEAPMANLTRIRRECEALASGQPVLPALFSDPHHIEIPEHFAVLNSDEARMSPAVFEAVSAHVLTHLEQWRTADPAILAALGIPPAPPPMDPAMMGAPATGTPPPEPGANGGTPPPAKGEPSPASPPGGAGQPAGPSLPTNPATGEEYTPTGGVANA